MAFNRQKLLAPLIILVVLLGAGLLVLTNPPESNRRGQLGPPQTVVETITVRPGSYSITISSYGTVQPRTRSVLVAQVGGQIMEVKAEFRPGRFFNSGDTLLVIDRRDYEADVKIAEASLMDAIQAQAQEAARAEQARIDWQRLGDPEEAPSDLVLRRPQLQAAKARVQSARSALTKAQLDLDRATIRAPFSGRVLRQMADLGQVVNPGAELAEIYATDYVEIRLPVRNADLPFVDLPEADGASQPAVVVYSELGGAQRWEGRVVRTEGAIDEVARQLHVVAQVDDPFTARGQRRPLKIGEYVTAEISGRTLNNVIVIPTNTLYQNSYVYTVDITADTPVLQRRNIEIAWQNGVQAVISSGLQAGDLLVTTPLGQLTSGTPVRLAGAATARPMRGADGVAQ